MLNTIRKTSKLFSIVLNPILIIYFWLGFFIRFLLFGFAHACIFFQRIPKPAVIPILRSFGASIGKNCDLETGFMFHNCQNFKNIKIGDNCHIGKACYFDLRDAIAIEDNVVISMQCTFITHIDMTKSRLNNLFPPDQEKINIKRNAYIGVRSTVLKGVTISDNAFIGAGSLVKTDVEINSLVAGVPAKIVKRMNVRI